MKLKFVAIFSILLSSITAFSAKTIIVDESTEQIKLGPSLAYYTDKSKDLDLDDIRKLNGQEWNKFKSNEPSITDVVANHWIRCDIYNSSPTELNIYLSIEYAHIAQYQVYNVTQDRIDSTNIQGDNYKFSDREMKLNYFVHKLKMNPNSSHTLYMRFDQEGQDLPLPIFIRSASNLAKNNADRFLFHGISIGIIFIIALSIFFIYRTTKIEFLLIETIVLLLSILYVISEEGYGFMYIWGDVWPNFNGYSRPLTIGIISIMNLFVSLSFLEFRKKNPKLYRLTIRVACVFTLSIILFHPIFLIPIQNEHNIGNFILFFLVTMAIMNAYNTYLVLYSYIKYKNKDAFILLLVYAIIPLVIIARSLVYLGSVPTNIIAQHGGIIVLTFHSIVIGSFMIYKGLQIFNDKQSTILKLSEDKRMAAVSMLENLNNERERISMDIHDSLGSLLSGVSLNLQSLKEKYPVIESTASFNNSIQYISKLDEEMRNISHNLLPNTLKEFGLIHAINKLIENEKHSKMQYSFEYQGFEERLAQNIELEIYRMILEMIDNIKKHAHAKNVLIQLNKYKDELNLIIEDDGVGYRPKKIRDGANGLKNLHNRIKLLNGDIDIYTRIGEGTSISMNIPTLRI